MTLIKLCRTLTWLSMLTVLLLAPMMQPTYAAPADQEKITLDFKDVELTDLINTISELTGKNFIYDDSVRGKVTIISPESMTLDETYQLFLTVLNVKGFTVVPSGKVNKIVSTKVARQEGLPVYSQPSGKSSGEFITRMVRLDHLDVDTVATSVLAPLMPATGNIITYAPTNTLILTETAATIDRMIRILERLDQPDSFGDLAVLELEYANAEEVAEISQEILAEQATATRRRRSNQKISTTEEGTSKIIPYSRTNSLIVLSNKEDLEKIRSLVAMLDKEVGEAEADINVYYLENADAETLATTLNSILTGVKAQAKEVASQNPNSQNAPLTSQPVSITADKPTNALIINAQNEDYNLLKSIIRKLDIKRKQVYVEALILELSMNASKELGASLSGAIDLGSDSAVFGTSNLNTGTSLANLSPTNGTASLLSQTVEGILLGGLFNPITVTGLNGEEMTVPALSALIDLSKGNTDINILSAPRLLTSDNEEAEIVVGQNVPIITERLSGVNSNSDNGLSQSVSVERQDVALTLRFTPQVIEDNLVRLNIYQEITDLAQSSVGDIDQVGPTLTKRLVRNTVLAQSQKTIVLGGLIGRNIQKSESKVPLLGDIPGVGWLFRHSSTTEQKTNLLVFITPTIIKNPQDLLNVTRQNKKDASGLLIEEQRSALPEGFEETEESPQTGTDMGTTPQTDEVSD